LLPTKDTEVQYLAGKATLIYRSLKAAL
jgi:hypothetical protein